MNATDAATTTPTALDGLSFTRDGRLGTLRIERPPLNILDLATLRSLDRLVAELERDEALQLLVVCGAGERAFSAGVAVEDHVGERMAPTLAAFHGALRRLRELPALTLAVVDGHCLGGGFELALACDLVVASEESRFGLPEIKLGCYPPVAAALLPRLLGRARALELMATGRTLGAAEVNGMGLLNRCVPRVALAAAVDELVAGLLAQSGAVLRLLKRATQAGEELPFAPALAAAERLYLEELLATADMNEGIGAFLAKRAPVWQHR